jgi:hypothetical protein
MNRHDRERRQRALRARLEAEAANIPAIQARDDALEITTAIANRVRNRGAAEIVQLLSQDEATLSQWRLYEAPQQSVAPERRHNYEHHAVRSGGELLLIAPDDEPPSASPPCGTLLELVQDFSAQRSRARERAGHSRSEGIRVRRTS